MSWDIPGGIFRLSRYSHKITVDPAKASNPINKGNRLEDDLSAYHPATGDATSNAAP